jgi:hypothetical protein
MLITLKGGITLTGKVRDKSARILLHCIRRRAAADPVLT